MGFKTKLYSELLKSGWGDAIQLASTLSKFKTKQFKKWEKSGSTTYLKEICKDYRNWSMFDRKDPMPFENDLAALDACWLKVKGKDNDTR